MGLAQRLPGRALPLPSPARPALVLVPAPSPPPGADELGRAPTPSRPRWSRGSVALSALIHIAALAAALGAGLGGPAGEHGIPVELVYMPLSVEPAAGAPPDTGARPEPPPPAPAAPKSSEVSALAELPPVPAPLPEPASEPVPLEVTETPPSEPVVALEVPPPPRPKPVPPPRSAEPAAHPAPKPAPKMAEAKPAPAPSPRQDATREPTGTGQTETKAESAATKQRPTAPSTAPVRTAAPPSGLAVVREPRFRRRPTPPDYPPRALAFNQEGTVLVRALVAASGESEDVAVWRSSGHALLDEAALRAVRGWAFEPARVAGRPVAAWVEVPVRFAIR